MQKSNLFTILSIIVMTLFLMAGTSIAEDALFIDEDGNVGIGTTSPGQKLQIKSNAENYSDLDGDVHLRLTGDSNTAEYVDLTYDDDSNQAIFRLNAGSAYRRNPALVLDYYDPQFRFVVSPDNQQNVAMAIKASGNVGIGTTSPNAKLDVSAIAYSTNRAGGIRIGDIGDHWDYNLYIRTDESGRHRFSIGYGSGENIVIKGSTGNVGIGTTDPGSYRLKVNGDLYADTVYTDSNTYADYVFEDDYSLETIDEHSDYMWSNNHLPALKGVKESEGKTNLAERLENAVAELEKAHIYIEQLHETNKRLEERLMKLELMIMK